MHQPIRPSFNFVNLKHPDDLKDGETQLRIRRLAMAEVGKARRKPRTKRGRTEIVLELRNPTQSPPEIDRLGSGRLDPFIRYPIALDDTSRALIANSTYLALMECLLLTVMSLQSREQPCKPAERIMVPGWTRDSRGFPSFTCKFTELRLPPDAWPLPFTR